MNRVGQLIMNTQSLSFSDGFQRLYCDTSLFDSFSTLHPISFARVLPFQADDPVVDDQRLIDAESAYLAARNDQTRQNVIEAYAQCGLLPEADATGLVSVINDFDPDFFETMGTIYANAGMFICALRWYREYIAETESKSHVDRCDAESVSANVGYCLYSLGLYPEAIAWSKCCIGPFQMADTVCRVLLAYESQLGARAVIYVERSTNRARYLARAVNPAQAAQADSRIKAAMKAFAPFLEIYINWVAHDAPVPEIQKDGYPFEAELDGGNLTRHRTNLIFATCAQADTLTANGFAAGAKQLLYEVAMLEPEADIIQDRLNALR